MGFNGSKKNDNNQESGDKANMINNTNRKKRRRQKKKKYYKIFNAVDDVVKGKVVKGVNSSLGLSMSSIPSIVLYSEATRVELTALSG